MSPFKKLSLTFMVLFVMAALLGVTVQPAAAAEAIACSKYHTVQRGEYLVKIARQYNTDWRTLAEINNLKDPSRIYTGQKLCVALASGSGGTTPTTGNTPTVYALSVVEDKEVTLRGVNLPANTRFDISLSKYNGTARSTVRVGSVYSNKNGLFTATYRIPNTLVDVQKITIRVLSSTGRSYQNWFYNVTADINTGGDHAPLMSISIVEVKEDDFVTVKVKDAPANVKFDVLMGKASTKGANGIKVATISTGKGGQFKMTFDIPKELRDKPELAIRMQNSEQYYVYTLFENADTP